jgi:succinyl-diaminopimelate desuccinylase
MTPLEALLQSLIKCPSITPNDAGCQELLQKELEAQGFICKIWNEPPVSNLFARIGEKSPFLLFAGHTDVVPVGDEHLWSTPPFELVKKNGFLYGRGTADMKGSLAAMLQASKRFLNDHPHFDGSLGFLITSGEEGNDFEKGTPFVMEKLKELNLIPDYCIVGEPSSDYDTGDIIKVGRRGSLSAELTFLGKQGHVAYPHLAINPIHQALQALTTLAHTTWDEGNAYFPPTSLQITHIHAKGHASNIIPGELHVHFNLRYSTEQTASGLIKKIENIFQNESLKPNITWRHNGVPFLTAQGDLLEACIRAIEIELQRTPVCSTSGGTSDGRFIAPYGVQVIELGPSNQTIHQVNERVSLKNLIELEQVYYRIMAILFHA